MLATLLHIPHSSTIIPEDHRSSLILTDDELRKELISMTDWYTDELFSYNSKSLRKAIFPISRLIVDPERFPDDEIEVMASKGMGVIYEKTSTGGLLRNQVSNQERQKLLDQFYYPHHRHLEHLVDSILSQFNNALVIDCHSFPSRPLPYEIDQRLWRPDICIGADSYHTPDWLLERCVNLFKEAGFSVSVNRPFSGALVPGAYFEKDKRVCGVMIEVNRGLYIDERNAEKVPAFREIQKKLGEIVKKVSLEFLDRCAGPSKVDR